MTFNSTSGISFGSSDNAAVRLSVKTLAYFIQSFNINVEKQGPAAIHLYKD